MRCRFFLDFMRGCCQLAAARENLHFYPMNRELQTITLPRSDRAVIEVAGG
jgi:hypothetical protein